MKPPDWQQQTICRRDGFKIVLSFEYEDEDSKKHFIDFCGLSEEEYKPIANYYWFCAKVTAFKGKIECASVYLGGNAYKTLMDALGTNPEETGLSGYMPQLIDELIEEAHTNLDD